MMEFIYVEECAPCTPEDFEKIVERIRKRHVLYQEPLSKIEQENHSNDCIRFAWYTIKRIGADGSQ